jgi:hypothetical protein
LSLGPQKSFHNAVEKEPRMTRMVIIIINYQLSIINYNCQLSLSVGLMNWP